MTGSGAGRLWASVFGFMAMLVVLSVPVAAQHSGGVGPMGSGSGMGGGVGWFGLGPLLWVLLIGAVIVLLGNYIRSDPQSSQHHDIDSRDDARATLRKRYARGELSAEEYERRQRTLIDD